MPKLSIAKGATSVLVRIFIQDSSSTVGAGLTGLTSGSAGLVCYRARDDDGNAGGTQIVLSAGTRGTWSSGGFVEKDSTNMPGWYEFGIPNNALVTGSRSVDIHFKGATNMAPLPIEIELTGWDNQDGVHGGMTALPNAAAAAAGGLVINGTNTGPITVTGGLVLNGTAASGATPATAGLTCTGGAASTTGGGTAGAGMAVTGGAGAATTNGAADGADFAGGGTTTVSGGHGTTFTGTGAARHGINAVGGASASNGIRAAGSGVSAGIVAVGGATGAGFSCQGGATSGVGFQILTTSGDGISIAPTAGHGITVTGNGTAHHGINATGAAASGANAAGHGISGVGGASSSTAGGTAGVGLVAMGGAGSATTNGAGDGAQMTGGGTVTVSGGNGLTATGTGNDHGASFVHAGTGFDLNATTTPPMNVNVSQINAVSTSGVTTINANQGTTQPINFTGTGASALVKSDMQDIAGSAVSTSTAQIGVNIVNIAGSASTGAAGFVGIDWAHINAPTTTVDLSNTTIKNIDNAPPGTLTAAQIATGVWQDSTASDFTVAGSIGKSLFTSGVVPGGAGGLMISGTNTGPWSVSGGVTFSNSTGDGFVCSSSGSNGRGMFISGNGTGTGLRAVGGGSGGNGIVGIGGAGGGNGIYGFATDSGYGLAGVSNTSGAGAIFQGGGTSGQGVLITSQSNSTGLQITGGTVSNNSDAMSLLPNGTGVALHCFPSGGGVGNGTITGTLSGDVLGHAGVDWSRVSNPTTVLDLSNTTIKGLDSGVTVVGNVTVGGYAAGQDPATLVLDVAASGHNLAGSIGQKINNVDVAVSSRMATFTLPANFSAMLISTAGNVGIDWAHVSNQATVVNLANTTVNASTTLSPAQIAAIAAAVVASPAVGPTGSIGGQIAKIGTGYVTVVSPIAVDGTLTLVKGDSYSSLQNRALIWSDLNAQTAWPDLTEAQITLEISINDPNPFVVAGDAPVPSGEPKTIRAQPTSVQTQGLTPGTFDFVMAATWLGTGTGTNPFDTFQGRVTLVSGQCIVLPEV